MLFINRSRNNKTPKEKKSLLSTTATCLIFSALFIVAGILRLIGFIKTSSNNIHEMALYFALGIAFGVFAIKKFRQKYLLQNDTDDNEY